MAAAAKTNPTLQRMIGNGPYALRIACSLFLFLLTACASPATPTPFLPPTAPASPSPVATILSLWTATPAPLAPDLEPSATPTAESTPGASIPDSAPTSEATPDSIPSPGPPPETCLDGLTFLEDLTVPDGSSIAPGERIDKQWRVRNSGSCDWDSGYRLKLVGGYPPLGAELSQQLFPARAGSEATIQIVFRAPPASGLYRSAWVAYNPAGQVFGDMIFIEFVVP